jgi:hypothetical protein
VSVCHDDNRLVANIAKKEVLVGNELQKVHTLHNTFRLYRESSLDMQSTLSIEKKMLCNFKNSINEVELKLLFAKSKYFFCNIVINHGEHVTKFARQKTRIRVHRFSSKFIHVSCQRHVYMLPLVPTLMYIIRNV